MLCRSVSLDLSCVPPWATYSANALRDSKNLASAVANKRNITIELCMEEMSLPVKYFLHTTEVVVAPKEGIKVYYLAPLWYNHNQNPVMPSHVCRHSD